MKDDKTHKKSAAQPASKESCSNIVEGKVVRLDGHNLVIKDNHGQEFTQTLAKDAKVTCDGASCQSTDLKAGRRIRVTTKKDDRCTVTGVESLSKHSEVPAAKS